MVWFLPVNAVPVVAAAVVGFIVGMAWFHESVFGRQWMKFAGIDPKKAKDKKKSGMAAMMVKGLIGQLVTAFVLAQLIAFAAVTSALDGAVIGVMVSVGFVLTSIHGGVLWEGKPMGWFWLLAGHSLVSLGLMGAVLGAMA